MDIHLITFAQCGYPMSFEPSVKVKCHDLEFKTYSIYKHSAIIRPLYEWRMLHKLKRKLQQKMDELHPDIIITTVNFYPEVICKLTTRAKIIVESHGAKSFYGYSDDKSISAFRKKIMQKKIDRRLSVVEKYADCIVALTNGDASEWKGKKVVVIPNMFEESQQTVKNYAVKRVIAIGRLSSQKGYDILMGIWDTIQKNHPDWHLDIFGDGEDRRKLEAIIIELNLQGSITLHHSTREVLREFSESSIFVFPSRYEGFPLTLGEAMSCGLPSIAFDCNYGPSDILSDDIDGYLVADNDTGTFAQRLSALMDDEDMRKRMGEAAKINIKRFSPGNIMLQWVELFNELSGTR